MLQTFKKNLKIDQSFLVGAWFLAFTVLGLELVQGEHSRTMI